MAGGKGGGSELLSRIGLAAASVLPPALLGARFWSSIRQHPVGALLLFLGYAGLLAVVAFLVKVYANVSDRWVGRAADAVDGGLRRRISRFEREYRGFVLSHHRFIDLKGLATRGDFTPRLEEVFIDVSLVPKPTHEVSRESLAGALPAGTAPVRQSIRDFLGKPAGTALAVIGAPGTGKTTMLKHLALGLARERGRRGRRDLPVLLLLRDHTDAISANPAITLPEIITASLRRFPAVQPPGWFDQRLREGRCVVLLDGLDEVAREEDRRRVSAWVESQIDSYEANDFILTSRPHGYHSAPVNRARVLQVRRFTGEQISRFVQGWYRAIERLSTGEDDAAVTERAEEGAQDLLERLRARPVLYDLAANPLLLTMIANVHRYRGALPGSRAELYGEICEVLLWRRREAQGAPTAPEELAGTKKEIVVRELAYVMMADRKRDIEAARAEEILRPILLRVAATVPVEDFLASIVASGLLVERERGLFAFAHLTLQEHLAARHISHRGLVQVLADAVDDDWWRETTLLYAARTDPAPVVDACLDSGSITALALAFDCEEEAAELDPDTARRLRDSRTDMQREGVASPRYRLLTAVMVTRVLRDTVPLGEDTVVCARPVPRSLFQFFGVDRRLGLGPQLSADRPEGTALGMTGRQATTFVAWVNELLPDGSGYRLPTLAEVEDPGFRLVAHAGRYPVWCAPRESNPAGPPRLWVPRGMRNPWSPVGVRPTSMSWLGHGRQDEVALAIGQLALGSALVLSEGPMVVRSAPRRTSYRSFLEVLREFAESASSPGDVISALPRLCIPEVGNFGIGEFGLGDFLSGRVESYLDAYDLLRTADRLPDAFLAPGRSGVRIAAWTTALLLHLRCDMEREAEPIVSFADYVKPVLWAPVPGSPYIARLDAITDPARISRRQHGAFLASPGMLLPIVERLSEAVDSSVRALAEQPGAVAPSDLPCLRLAALTLSAVAARLPVHSRLSDDYLALATALLVHEQRADGTLTPNETLVLVRA